MVFALFFFRSSVSGLNNSNATQANISYYVRLRRFVSWVGENWKKILYLVFRNILKRISTE